jgi:DinB superfamily
MVVTADTRRALVERYREGHHAVVDALEGITEQELDARPGPDEWTAREIVHHLGDAEMTSAIRLRRLLVEDQPVINAYDEVAFARVLHYAERPIEPALEALAAARRSTAQILERLSEAEWARSGSHSESGFYSVDTWLEMYAAHAHEHADQIRRARSALQ